VCLPACLSACLPACLSVCLTVALSVTADSAVIRVSTELNSRANDESFAIDDVQVSPCTRATEPAWNPSPVRGVVPGSLPTGKEAVSLKTRCCLSNADCQRGHSCYTNVCYADYALAYDFRYAMTKECTDSSYLDQCDSEDTCSEILDRMTACGPLPGTPPVVGYPSASEVECAQTSARHHWHIGRGYEPIADCTACENGDLEACFDCCSFIRNSKYPDSNPSTLGHCCQGACCDLKLANEAEALCVNDAPEWHNDCYVCNERNDEWTNQGYVWIPERYPDTGT
jgi:hypothetical protein